MKHIRIISPSGVIDPAYIDGATARLRAWGYKVSEGAHARDEWGRFAGTDAHRIADFNEAMEDKDVDLILCSRGGYGLQRILCHLLPVKKPIIGFSDITALHQYARSFHQPTLHGIMCKHLATLPKDSEPIVAFRKALEGEPLEYTWSSHPLNREGEAEGILIGGNLSVLAGLQATPWGLNMFTLFQKHKPILLIEDVGEWHYHIDRMMRNLLMSEVLENISGLIVGQFTDCEDDPLMNGSIYETIKEAVADYDYPVLFDAPIGHVEHNMPVWMNAPARIASASGASILSSCGRRSV